MSDLTKARHIALTSVATNTHRVPTIIITMIAEFTDFADIRTHKRDALMTQMEDSLWWDPVTNSKPDWKMTHNGITVTISDCEEVDEERYIQFMPALFASQGSVCCRVNTTLSTTLLSDGTWYSLAEQLLCLLDDRGLCVFCDRLTDNISKICTRCILLENETPCRCCHQSIGYINRYPINRAGAHPKCLEI